MRRKNHLILWMLVLLLVGCAGCGKKELTYQDVEITSEDDSDWKTAEAGDVISLQNGDIRFEFDTATTHFHVENTKKNIQFDSYLSETDAQYSGEVQKRMNSEITIVYYEEQSEAQYMYSDTDSVANGTYRVVYDEHRIRCYYTFGATEENAFIPHVFSEEMMERFAEELKESGGSDGTAMARRLKGFYKLYTKDTATDSIKTQYPEVDDTALYVINDPEDMVDIAEIVSYMNAINYSITDYKEELESEGLTVGDTAQMPGFVVPVEYSVQEDGFSARILTDKTEEFSDDYKLQSVIMLEYLGGTESQEGQFFVPDGSGALIDWNGHHVSEYSQSFYGDDYSIQADEKNQFSENSSLPVYGLMRPFGGLLTIVEEGAENGTLYAKNTDCSATPNHLYTAFKMRHMDVTDIGKNQLIPIYNLFVEEIAKTCPTQRYVLLSSEESNWTWMAQYVRQYMIDNEWMKVNEKVDTPLYLTYLGMYLKDTNVLGVSYDKKVVFSELDKILDDVRYLSDNQIGDAIIRLEGFTSDGIAQKANNRFELSGKLGSIAELKKLNEITNENGGSLFWDADISFVYKNGNGFSKRDDSAQFLNREFVYRGNYDIVTRKYDNNTLARYFVSPNSYLNYANKQLKDMKQDLGFSMNLSYGKMGMYLGGDYSKKDTVDRTTAVRYLEETLNLAKMDVKQMCFDYGNAYVLPYAAALYNAPLKASDFDGESESVPFYEMVLHGSISYAGTPLNLSYNQIESILRTIEYGAAFSYTLITEDSSTIVGTDLETIYYSMNSRDNLNDFMKLWSRYAEFYREVANQTMISHQKVNDGVFCTTYENGYQAYVNYNDTEYAGHGVTVKAQDFTLVMGGEE